MGVQISGGRPSNPNGLCPCGSGLKFKYCHGDPVKQALCSQIANEYMAGFIWQEQKKRGLVPYDYICNDCGEGFDKPNQSIVAPYLLTCPKCGAVDIKENKGKEVENAKSEKSEESRI